jgi:hypothetical protein
VAARAAGIEWWKFLCVSGRRVLFGLDPTDGSFLRPDAQLFYRSFNFRDRQVHDRVQILFGCVSAARQISAVALCRRGWSRAHGRRRERPGRKGCVGQRSDHGENFGWQVLATSNEEGTGDSIRAYEFPDRDPIAVSAAIDFQDSGITALWTEAKGDTAIAVVKNRETGRYEAFRLAVVCSQ